jgi:hypothetical protein
VRGFGAPSFISFTAREQRAEAISFTTGSFAVIGVAGEVFSHTRFFQFNFESIGSTRSNVRADGAGERRCAHRYRNGRSRCNSAPGRNFQRKIVAHLG